jgi:hypothetical protein
VVFALSRHPASRALPLLERLLASPDPETRRESFLAASRYPDERVGGLCLDRLLDRDPEVRTASLDTLVRRGGPELGLRIQERILARDHFERLPLLEKRRLFAAVAKLASESALDGFHRILGESRGREERWFTKRKDRDFFEAVAHGIRMVGSPRALQILEEVSRSGGKLARAACLKELSGARS